MAKARPVELAPGEAFADAALKVVATRSAELFAQSSDVLDTSDIERVHDMRVATRRLRAMLEIFEACFEKKAHRHALRRVKRLADTLGQRRDPDVHIALVERYAAAAPAGDDAGVTLLIERLRAEQAEANEALASQVAEAELESLHAELNALVGEA